MELKFGFFEKPGKENTEESLKLAKINADNLGISDIVIASTWGNTAKKAIEIFEPKKYNIVIVTHNFGFKEGLKQEFDSELRTQLKEMGVKVHSGTLAFSGVDSALLNTHQYWGFQALYGKTIRTIFGDGIKVCQEIVLMAADSGFVEIGKNVISIAGKGTGADTVCLIKSSSSRMFLDLKVKAILAKPL
jgi:hypothetical protein